MSVLQSCFAKILKSYLNINNSYISIDLSILPIHFNVKIKTLHEHNTFIVYSNSYSRIVQLQFC